MLDTIETIDVAADVQSAQTSPSSLSPQPSALSLSFSVPQQDLARFASLPDTARNDLRRSFFALQTIHNCRDNIGVQEACRIQAAKCMHTRGFTAASLVRKYYNYLQSGGDWTVLVNKALAGPAWWNTQEDRGLPTDFLQFWRTLCERNQRKCKPAHRELLRIWRTGQDSEGRVYKSIPGYPLTSIANDKCSMLNAQCALPPEPDPFTGIPRGWSYENLQRSAPDDFSLVAARQGRAAATQLARKVFKTRVGLSVGEFYLFDDQEYDKKVNFVGRNQRRAMRPLGLNALDLFSACSFAYGLKPTLIGDDGAKQKLKEIDMMWFVVHVLTHFGYNPDTGTTLIVEHGTAAIRTDFEERIHLVTNGSVKVDRSGLHGKPAIAALFEGASKGNPRFKAPLESFFNLVRNEMAQLPVGEVGKDRDHSPEELYGRDRENNRLIQAAQYLSPEQQAQLKYPFMDWPSFVLLAMEIYRRINHRTDHALEGWEKANLVENEWRLDPSLPWMSMDKFLALPDAQQQTVRALLSGPAAEALCRTRKLSPQEVFNRSATRLQKISHCLLPDLLGPDFGVLRTVRDGTIEIKDHEIDSDPMHFTAWLGAPAPLPAQCSMKQLPNGTTVRAYLNPFNPTVLVVTDPRTNAYIATLPRQETPTWSDAQGIQRQLAAQRTELSDRLQQLGIRHTDRARERLDTTRHNNAVLNGQLITPEDRAADRAFEKALATNIATPQTENPIEKEYL